MALRDWRNRTDDQLVKQFEELAIIHRELETPEKANKAFDEQVKIWDELKNRGPAAISVFLGLLRAPSAAVRLNSASLALFVAPEEAESVLEQLTTAPKLLGFSASMTLKQWRAGKLKPLV